jgi:hypothetical protein
MADDWTMGALANQDSYDPFAAEKFVNPVAQGLVGTAIGAVLAPGRALQSTEPITSEQMIKPAADLAMMTTLGAGAVPQEANTLNMGIKAYHSASPFAKSTSFQAQLAQAAWARSPPKINISRSRSCPARARSRPAPCEPPRTILHSRKRSASRRKSHANMSRPIRRKHANQPNGDSYGAVSHYGNDPQSHTAH